MAGRIAGLENAQFVAVLLWSHPDIAGAERQREGERGSETGPERYENRICVVGSVAVSGLPHAEDHDFEDHAFVVSVLQAFLEGCSRKR